MCRPARFAKVCTAQPRAPVIFVNRRRTTRHDAGGSAYPGRGRPSRDTRVACPIPAQERPPRHRRRKRRRRAQAIKENRIDAVVLDIMMPGEDGLSSLPPHSRDQPHPRHSLSARAENSTASSASSRPADDYVVKPFNPASCLRASTRSYAAPTPCPQTSNSSGGRCASTVGRSSSPSANWSMTRQRPELSTGEYRLLLPFCSAQKSCSPATNCSTSPLTAARMCSIARRYASEPSSPQDRSRRALAQIDQRCGAAAMSSPRRS